MKFYLIKTLNGALWSGEEDRYKTVAQMEKGDIPTPFLSYAEAECFISGLVKDWPRSFSIQEFE